MEDEPCHCLVGVLLVLTWKINLLVIYCSGHCRVRQAMQDKAKVIDVDGSYLYRNQKQLQASGVNVAPLDVPPPLLTCWESVSEGNVKLLADKIPRVTTGARLFYACINVYLIQ